MKKNLIILLSGVAVGITYLFLSYAFDIYYLANSSIISDYFGMNEFWGIIASGIPLFIWAVPLFYFLEIFLISKVGAPSFKQKVNCALIFALGVYCLYLIYILIGFFAFSKAEFGL
jgi:hypothetical protein